MGFCFPGPRANLHEPHELLDVRMQFLAAGGGAPSSRLKLRSLELDVQRVHEPVHQAPKGCHRRELHDLGAIEVFGKLRERFVVMARLVPGDSLGPPDNGLLTLAEKRTLEVIVGT
jgi:hypothetical protein